MLLKLLHSLKYNNCKTIALNTILIYFKLASLTIIYIYMFILNKLDLFALSFLNEPFYFLYLDLAMNISNTDSICAY